MMEDFRRCYAGNLWKKVPDAYIRRFGGMIMVNEDFKDVVRFNKSSHNTRLLGASAEGGRFIYGTVGQFESFYGDISEDGDQNVCSPTNMKVDRDDLTEFNFQYGTKAILLTMGGSLLCFDLESRKTTKLVTNSGASVFCSSFDNQDCLLFGNCASGELKLFDMRNPDSFKCISNVKNTPTSLKRKANVTQRWKLKALCHLGDKYFASGYSLNEKSILIWDMRYVKSSEPVQSLNLTAVTRSEFGVYSMQLDRTHTRLIAGCTDGCFREYSFFASNNPINFYCGGLSNFYDKSFAVSPFTDHFVASTRNGTGIWDHQETYTFDVSWLQEKKNKSPDKTPTTKTSTPSRLFMSPGLAGTPPRRSLVSPYRSFCQLSLNNTKLPGTPAAKFQFKPLNEQTVHHCDWSACGRYIVMTSDTNFTLCDSESDWSRNSANDDHFEATNKFSGCAIPLNFTFPSYVHKAN